MCATSQTRCSGEPTVSAGCRFVAPRFAERASLPMIVRGGRGCIPLLCRATCRKQSAQLGIPIGGTTAGRLALLMCAKEELDNGTAVVSGLCERSLCDALLCLNQHQAAVLCPRDRVV